MTVTDIRAKKTAAKKAAAGKAPPATLPEPAAGEVAAVTDASAPTPTPEPSASTAEAPDAPSPDIDGRIYPIWEVLTPFKFRGLVVKPPQWLHLPVEEAQPYQDAGVLGTEPNAAGE